MKNLYNEADKNEILNRLENLKVDAVNGIAYLIGNFCQKLLTKKALPKVPDVLHRLSVLIGSAYTNSYDFHLLYMINL